MKKFNYYIEEIQKRHDLEIVNESDLSIDNILTIAKITATFAGLFTAMNINELKIPKFLIPTDYESAKITLNKLIIDAYNNSINNNIYYKINKNTENLFKDIKQGFEDYISFSNLDDLAKVRRVDELEIRLKVFDRFKTNLLEKIQNYIDDPSNDSIEKKAIIKLLPKTESKMLKDIFSKLKLEKKESLIERIKNVLTKLKR